MKEINVILGEKVKEMRWKKGLTRETLAEKVGVSPRFLADVESGKIGVSIQSLKKLALSLDASTDYLLGLDQSLDTNLPLDRKLADVDKKYLPLLIAVAEELRKLD